MDRLGSDFGPIMAQPHLQGELSLTDDQHADRRAERRTISVVAALRRRGTPSIPVQLVDLSTDGFRFATHLDMHAGQDVWVRLPGLEPYHATVAWTDGTYVGCAFERPLHPAVFDMVVLKARGNA